MHTPGKLCKTNNNSVWRLNACQLYHHPDSVSSLKALWVMCFFFFYLVNYWTFSKGQKALWLNWSHSLNICNLWWRIASTHYSALIVKLQSKSLKKQIIKNDIFILKMHHLFDVDAASVWPAVCDETLSKANAMIQINSLTKWTYMLCTGNIIWRSWNMLLGPRQAAEKGWLEFTC